MGIFSLTPGGMLGDLIKTALTGPLIGGMVDGYKAKIASGTAQDQMLAELAGKELVVEQRERELMNDLDRMDSGRWWTAAPRAIVQWAVAFYIAKVIVWDLCLDLGSTPDIKSVIVANAFNLIIVMWFGGRTVEKVSKIISNRFAR